MAAVWPKVNLHASRSVPRLIRNHLLPSLRQHASARLVTASVPLIQLNGRSFISSSAQPAQSELPQPPSGDDWEKMSPEAKIQHMDDNKWGWVILRTSYASEFNSSWDDLKHYIHRIREAVAESDAPGIAERMDFIFVEDPTLEGASIAELQHRFQAWARDDNTSGLDLDNASPYTSRGSRYEYFINVDGEGLWSGYVCLVQGWSNAPGNKDWPDALRGEDSPDALGSEDWSDAPESEDWMKIKTSAISTWLYVTLDNPEVWYAYYTSPESGICTAV